MSARPGLLVAEALAGGVAAAGALGWAGAALVAVFRPTHLAAPYWSALPHLRIDTLGIIAFAATAAGLAVGEYLRLRRGGSLCGRPTGAQPNREALAGAAAGPIALLSAAGVLYLSLNGVTHPETLELPLTHLVSWPSEGSARIAGLVAELVSITVLRYRAAAREPANPSVT